MSTTEEIVVEVWERLARHFRKSADSLTPEQVSEMTTFSLDDVKRALAVLWNTR